MLAALAVLARITLAPADTAALALVNVTVIPMDRERAVPGQTVVVRDGRIVAIGPTGQVEIPRGAVRIEGSGKYLVPGLAEMHAHIPGPQAPDEVRERVLALYALNGITTIRGMLGHPMHLELRERAAAGAILSPRIYTSGPSLNGNSVPSVEAAVRAVTEQKAAGYDFLKIHPGLAREVFDSLDAAADRLGIRFAGHVPQAVGIERALEARYWSIDHLDGYIERLAAGSSGAPQPVFFGVNLGDQVDESGIPALAAATRAAGVWNVPTQTLLESLVESPEALAGRPELRYWPAQQVAQWLEFRRGFLAQSGATAASVERIVEVRRRLIKALHDAGAGLLLGSDAPQVWNVPGFSIHRELEAMVAAGLTPYQALRTGTVNVAAFFGTERESGTVEVGKRADLVLLDANPLANVGHTRRIAGVVLNGRWLPGDEIRRRLEEIATRVRG